MYKTFRLLAGDPGEKWVRAWSRDGRKCRPVVVPLAGRDLFPY